MTCVFARENQSNSVPIWQRVDTRQILISSLIEENMLDNNTEIKQTQVVKPVKTVLSSNEGL